MFLTPLDLTRALLPEYLPNETLLLIQDEVGLYQGKFKLPKQQRGKVYLTSHRICYVDSVDPKQNSLAIELKSVERYEFYGGFFKSSPKVSLYPKASRPRVPISASGTVRGYSYPYPHESPVIPAALTPATPANWICTICSFSNQVPRGFDPTTATIHTPLEPCKACGIKPSLAQVLKATISSAASRQGLGTPSQRPSSRSSSSAMNASSGWLAPPGTSYVSTDSSLRPGSAFSEDGSVHCPRCTFANHPSLPECEVCGLFLTREPSPTAASAAAGATGPAGFSLRTESPGPMLLGSAGGTGVVSINEESHAPIKISFRAGNGGEKTFYERLKSAMVQRKWIVNGASTIPWSNMETYNADGSTVLAQPSQPRPKVAGVAGLEQRAGYQRKNNEVAIGNAFEDLESLMASAKEIIALAENFARQTSGQAGSSEASLLAAESAAQLGITTTKDVIAGSKSESLYLSELSRNIAEYVLDDTRNVLKKSGGIITLIDLWAMFNRSRGGVELVSPRDFEKAVSVWESLQLPLRLRRFNSGVIVVQAKDRTDESTIRAIESWMRQLHAVPPLTSNPEWDWQMFGHGVTPKDAAEKFGWSIGVAVEELEMAEERGVLCREAGIQGVRYWENFIMSPEDSKIKGVSHPDTKPVPVDQVARALEECGFI